MTSSSKLNPASLTLGDDAIGTGALKISNLFNVSGQVAIVTGGGTGLGLVTAAALAENGAKVYITGRRKDVLEAAAKQAAPKEGPGSVTAITADAATKEGITQMKEFISQREKWINILVNNHGVSQGNANITEAEQTGAGIGAHMFDGDTFDRWLDTYRINTASYYFTTMAFLPLLTAAKDVGKYPESGNVLNISSISGITKTSQRGQMNYNASKAATISLSDMMATEFARRNLGVRVNTIAPGYFPSGMTTVDPSNDFALFRGEKWSIPFGRPGNAVDYAQCVISVVTNQYQTASHVVIDGGWLLEQAF